MPSYLFRDSYYKNKTVSWLSYLYNENPHTWKDGLYIEAGPNFSAQWYSDAGCGVSVVVSSNMANQIKACKNQCFSIAEIVRDLLEKA